MSAPSVDDLRDLLLESRDFDSFLLDLTLYSAKLGGEEPILCAISVQRNGAPFTVASSGGLARLLDERQYELDDGSCLAALRTGRVDELQGDPRWVRYLAAVKDTGVRAVHAGPSGASRVPSRA